jgi:hypothetical protein
MGRRIVKIDPGFWQQLLTDGIQIPGQSIRVQNGVLPGARFVRGWYEGEEAPNGCFCLLFEHEDWTDVADGASYPVLTPTLIVTFAYAAGPDSTGAVARTHNWHVT